MDKKLHIIKLIAILFLISIFFLMAGCDDSTEVIENQYQNSINILEEQVYTRNKNTTKISQVYQSYTGTHDIEAFFFLPDPDPDLGKKATIGLGNLINGVLDFTVLPENITEDNLLEWNYLKAFFSSESRAGAWKNVNVIKPENIEIKGNLLLLDAYTSDVLIGGMIDRQKLVGDRSSLSCETILYFYLNEDCTISGDIDIGYHNGDSYYQAGKKLYLPLKKGWNLVTRTEKYSTDSSGYATISMEIKPITNPQDYKWVMN